MPKNDRTLKFFDFFRYFLHPPVNISKSYLHKRGLYHSKIIQNLRQRYRQSNTAIVRNGDLSCSQNSQKKEVNDL